MIKAICFDWGGVLVKSKPIIPGIAKILDMDKDELYKFYLQYNHLAGVGNMSYKDVWTLVLEKLGKSDKVEEVHRHREQQHSYDPIEGMIELVNELRSKNYKLGVLSNNTKDNGEWMRQNGLDQHFDCLLISAEIGFQKPDPRAFQVLFDSLGVKPEEAIFTDDSIPSLSTADQIGYHPILFTGYEDFKTELQKLNVI